MLLVKEQTTQQQAPVQISDS